MRAISREDVLMEPSPKAMLAHTHAGYGYGYGRPRRAHNNSAITTPSISMTNNSDHVSYVPPPRSRGGTGSSFPTNSQRRFVAGRTFFNYEAFGSLRPGQDWIRLFSARYVGLAVHVTICGFTFYFFSYGYGRLLAEYLKANDERQVQAAHYVLVWPQALSLVIGLVSDCFPFRGYKRKSYMVLGWIISLAMYIAIIVMDTYSNSGRMLYKSEWKEEFDSAGSRHGEDEISRYPVAYLAVSLVAAFGIQISWLAAMAVSVEYAQREQLHHRGRLQATLVALYYLGGVAAQLVTACVISDGVNRDHLVSTLSVGGSATVLAVVSAFAIPFVLLYFHEEPVINTTRVGMSVTQRLKEFWRFCHQNVVYRVLFFIILHLFLVGLFNQNVRDAVQRWSHVSRAEALIIEVTRMAAMMASVLAWKYFMRNTSWRKLAFWGSLFYIAAYIALTVLTTCDLVRNEWFYGVMMTVADVPRAWLVLYAVILATEISDVGREGVTLALGMSYQTLAGLAGYTLGAIFPSLGFKVTMAEVEDDAAETRANVMKAFLVVTAINLVSFPLIFILPQQKLDATNASVRWLQPLREHRVAPHVRDPPLFQPCCQSRRRAVSLCGCWMALVNSLMCSFQ